MSVLTIGISGGSGSGKTTIASKIIEAVGSERISFLEMDSYYKELDHLSVEERAKNNFDHPASLDIDLYIHHVEMLKSGKSVEKPQYDFVNHTRKLTTTRVESRPVVILEGILLYENPILRDYVDIKTFVETPSDIRFIRRLMRDIEERGRTPDSVVRQYYGTVRPMYKTFVAQTKEYADVIIPWQGYNEVAVGMVISRVEHCLAERSGGFAVIGSGEGKSLIQEA